MDLSLRMLADASNAQGAFKDLGSAVTAVGAVILDFSKQSVQAFMEAERVQKQLARAAGENTEAFSHMADVMSEQLAVEDEHVKTLQTLALNYDVLPQNVEGATRAVLDWSAATGKDAKGAMLELIKSVEAGTGSLDRGRIQFRATGDEAKDLANAIEALNGKFGGAAAADADTMEGRVRAANIAVGELKETVGQFLATLEAKMGVLDRFNTGMRLLLDPQGFMSRKAAAATPFGGLLPAMGPGVKGAGESGTEVTVGDITFEETKGSTAAAKRRQDELETYLNAENQYYDRQWVAAREAERADLEARRQYEDERMENQRRLNEDLAQLQNEEAEERRKMNQEILDNETAVARDALDLQRRELEERKSMWARAGSQIGQAIMNGIFEAIMGLTAEGENDKQRDQRAIKITQGLMNAIFSMFGMGGLSQGMFAAMNSDSAEGTAAGMFGTMGSAAVQSGFSQHTGGFIERFHAGGPVLARDERMAVLQTGERVLSRGEVSRMGGMGGVNDAAGGGGGRSLVIQAFDSSSILEFFGDRGGRGMLNAARTNTGPLALMFGRA